MKKRLKAPRELVEATKKGERFVPARQIDTRATHMRRFSKAVAAYACVAVVLIAGVAVLPMLLGGEPVPSTSAQSTSALLDQTEYTPLSEEQAKNYFRPDLIWASEFNPELTNFVIWSAEVGEDGIKVTQPTLFPNVGVENARYAVEIKMEFLGTNVENGDAVSMNAMKRQYARVETAMKNIGVETLKNEYGYDLGVSGNFDPDFGNLCFSKYYELGHEQLTEADVETVLSGLGYLQENTLVEVKIAWQSVGQFASDSELNWWRTDWQATQIDGKQKAYSFDCVYNDTREYVVRITVKDMEKNLMMGTDAYNVYKRKIAHMEEEMIKAGFQKTNLDLDPDTNKNVYYSVDYVISGEKLNKFDTDIILSNMGSVDANLYFSICIWAKDLAD